MDKRELKHVTILDAVSDINGRVACPNCGLYNFRCIDYDYSPTSKSHLGPMVFVGVCLTKFCNQTYKYYGGDYEGF